MKKFEQKSSSRQPFASDCLSHIPLLTESIQGSVAVRRPLHLVIVRLLGRGDARYAEIASRAQARTSMVITAIIGLAFVAHAAAIATLALTQPASTFDALQHVFGLPIYGLGLAAVLFYRSRLQARQRAAAGDGEPGQAS